MNRPSHPRPPRVPAPRRAPNIAAPPAAWGPAPDELHEPPPGPQLPMRAPPPAPKRASKALIAIRLIVAAVAVLVAGVVVIVWMLTRDAGNPPTELAQTAQQTPPPAVRQPLRRAPSKSATTSAKPENPFLESIGPWVAVLEVDATRLQQAFDDLTVAHQRVAREAAGRQRDELSAIDEELRTHRDTLAQSDKAWAAGNAELQRLLGAQAPEIPFVLAHANEASLSAAAAEARNRQRETAAAWDAAEEAIQDLIRRRAQGGTDETMGRLEDQINQERLRQREARDAERKVARELADLRNQLGAVRTALSAAFQALPQEGADATELRQAWTTVLEKRDRIAQAEAAADDASALVGTLNSELGAAQSEAAEKERVWKAVHDEALRVSKLATEADERYQKMPTRANRERAEALIAQRDRLRDQDRAAKDDMHAARRAVTDLQRRLRQSEKDAEAAAASHEALATEAAGVVAAANKRIEAVAARLMPTEESRLKQLADAREAMAVADEQRAAARGMMAPLQSRREQVENRMREYSDHVRDMESFMIASIKAPLGKDVSALAEMMKAHADAGAITDRKIAEVSQRAEDVQSRVYFAGATLDAAVLSAEMKLAMAPELEAWRGAARNVTRVMEEIRTAAAPTPVQPEPR